MARQFTWKHYVAVADVLVAAYQQAQRHDYPEGAVLGIDIVRDNLTLAFSRDADKFDSDKFHKYIEARLSGRLAHGTGAPCEDCGGVNERNQDGAGDCNTCQNRATA